MRHSKKPTPTGLHQWWPISAGSQGKWTARSMWARSPALGLVPAGVASWAAVSGATWPKANTPASTTTTTETRRENRRIATLPWFMSDCLHGSGERLSMHDCLRRSPCFSRARPQDAPGRGPPHGQNLPRFCLFVVAGDEDLIEGRGADQAAANGQGGSFAAVCRPQFAEHIGDVVIFGARTKKEARGNLRIRQALTEESEHLLLAER